MISVIGVSMAIGEPALAVLRQADVIIGSKRQLQFVPDVSGRQQQYPHPFEQLFDILNQLQDKNVVLLASGDPLYHGIGNWLQQHFPQRADIQYFPNLSSVQLAFAQLGQPWRDATTVNLHGRPLATLRRYLSANRWLAILTDADNTPLAIANELVDAGLAQSTIHVFEQLATPDQRHTATDAKQLSLRPRTFHSNNVVIINTKGISKFCTFPGIEDESFLTNKPQGKGLITKREVRLNILSLLQPQPGEIGWDVGAGCGSVAVEWALWQPGATVYGIEKNPELIPVLQGNRQRFGVSDNLHIVAQQAPQGLADLPNPNKVFIGGNNGRIGQILDYCWSRLQANGVLVASAVTEQTRGALQQWCEDKQGECLELSIRKAAGFDSPLMLRPQLPVVIYRCIKPES